MDADVKNEELGFIRLSLMISPTTGEETSPVNLQEEKRKSCSSKLWNSVLTVTLLEGKNLPARDQNGNSVLP